MRKKSKTFLLTINYLEHSLCLSVGQSIRLSVCLSFFTVIILDQSVLHSAAVCRYVYWAVSLSACRSLCQSLCRSVFCWSVCRSVGISVNQ